MPKCVYCGKDYEFPKGLTLIGKDGKVNYLCSSKCRKNMKMNRRKVKWILKDKKDKKEKVAGVPASNQVGLKEDVPSDKIEGKEVKEEEQEIPKPEVKEDIVKPKVKEEKPVSESA